METVLHDLSQWMQEIGMPVFHVLPRIFMSLLVLLAFYILALLVRKYSYKFYARILKTNDSMAQLISVVLYVVVMVSGVFLALEVLGLEGYVTKMLAGAGIVGIIAGFAFKDIASNMFSGMLVTMQKPFKEGDWVSLDGVYGQVNDIGLITTSVKNISGQEVFVPNQLIYNSTFTNFSTYNKRRIILKTGVSYGDDLDKVKQVALDEINQIPALLKSDPIDFYFTDIGSYSYNFEVRFWINFQQQTDYLNAMSETIMRIKKRFEKENISIAYPVQTLDFGVKGGVNIFDKAMTINK